MEDQILKYVRLHKKTAFRKRELARRLNLKDIQYGTFRRTLNKLISCGHIIKIRGGKLIYASPDMFEQGILELTKTGRGFVITENNKRIYAGNGYFSGALHGDVVKIKIEYEYNGDISGKINKILSRSNKVLDGYVVSKKGVFYLEPLLRISNRPFLIKGDISRKLKQNHWVEAEIMDYPESPSPIPVIVKKILGDSNDPSMDLKIILKKFNLPEKFPKNVLRDVDRIKSKVKFEIGDNRSDYTKLNTFTIDPETAKDFDDAISIEQISKNRNRLGIHITVLIMILSFWEVNIKISFNNPSAFDLKLH